MTKEDWDFINEILDALIFRLNEQDTKIEHLQHLEQQIVELLEGVQK